MHWMKYEAWIDLLELALVAALGVGLAHVTWLAMAPRTAGAPSALARARSRKRARLRRDRCSARRAARRARSAW